MIFSVTTSMSTCLVVSVKPEVWKRFSWKVDFYPLKFEPPCLRGSSSQEAPIGIEMFGVFHPLFRTVRKSQFSRIIELLFPGRVTSQYVGCGEPTRSIREKIVVSNFHSFFAILNRFRISRIGTRMCRGSSFLTPTNIFGRSCKRRYFSG